MDRIEFDRLCRISSLCINDESKMVTTIDKIVTFLDKLKAVDVDKIGEFSNITNMPMRKDCPNDGGYAQKMMQEAPDSRLNMFVVPKVIEKLE